MALDDPVPDTASRPPVGRAGLVDRSALLEGLNPDQTDAVLHGDGPLLVVAGAGSGKTSVLTRRIARLIHDGASPFQILAITFTNKAASEMKERVGRLVGPVAEKMWVSTFHSACVRILRRDAERIGFRSGFTIYDQSDAQRLVGLLVRERGLDPKKFPPRAIHNTISAAKNDLVTADAYAAAAKTIFERKIGEVYVEYQQRLLAANAMDFDDLLTRTVELLRRCPDVLDGYRARFRHILVDEYQDTNKAQNALVIALAGEHANVCVVGDGDQSIYRFRGADIRNIEQLETAFPALRTIVLDQNYRSTQSILDAANAVIDHNSGRTPKNLWSDRGPGEKIVRYTADDEHDEAGWVAGELTRLRREAHERWSDMAVFYRTNAQSRAIEEAFNRRGIPYKVVGGTRFYDRREVKDAMAYLRAIANPDDEVSLKRIVNVPARGVGEKSVEKLDALAQRKGIGFGEAFAHAEEAGLTGKAASGVRALRNLLDDLRQLARGSRPDRESGELDLGGHVDAATPGEVLAAVLDRTGYLEEIGADGGIEAQGRVENVQELLGFASQYQTLDAFLEETSLVSDSDDLDADEAAADGGQVVLMTLHTSKGLEYDVVCLVGLEDGVFPGVKAIGEPVEMEEERRLAYVGITRAKRRLYLTNAWSRMLWGQTQYNPLSRFVREIPDELLRTAPGSRSGGMGSSLGGAYGGSGRGDRVRVYGAGNGSGLGYDDAGRSEGERMRDRIVEAALRSGRGMGPTRRGPAATIELHPGDDVVHGKWGEGVVLDVDDAKREALVRFPGLGDKRLDLTLAPLKRA